MASQIFKNKIPNELLFDLLNKICLKNEKQYTFCINSFRKGLYNEEIKDFLEVCRPYYHISKRKYIDKNLTYKSFTTILRQICNYNKIIYTSEIIYNKSKYDISYYIYF